MKQLEMGHAIAVGFLIVALSTIALACAGELPEAGSRDAELYVQYCSGEDCHTPIPPKALTARLWDMQYSRMIELMNRGSYALPSAEEERLILDYLHRHADGAES